MKRIIIKLIAKPHNSDTELKIKSSSRGIFMNNSKKKESDAVKIILKKNVNKRRKYNDNFVFILCKKNVDNPKVTKPTERQNIRKKTNK